jgi:toxin HigB-1
LSLRWNGWRVAWSILNLIHLHGYRVSANLFFVIASFKDKATADLFHGVASREARQWKAIEAVAVRKLDMVNAAAVLDDLKVPPGNRLEALKGTLAGYHSIRVNQQFRVVFKWRDGAAHEVSIVDYH